uniref:Lymphoid-restricted membrane protein n=1 Tax=Cynoglossus semilaevis TaxID=244447 RepID=A0A3P8WBM4_CYNSE
MDCYTPQSNRRHNPVDSICRKITLGERRGAEGSDGKQLRTWQRYCSTPTAQAKDSPYFTFTRGPQSESEEQTRSPLLSRTFTPSHNSMSYNLNFCSSDATTNPMECDLPYPALVVKRLSMGDGVSMASERKKENMAEISLICEENLLDTIFHACDTQRRGKVYVSHIVDYLRHTTSRSSGDSGLDELCNMLDPEHKDVSIDLDTYHAVMREWIDDCRNSTTQDSVKLKERLSARRSLLLNMTSGSLEAFGGEASRVEFETSELVYCVADLQMCNQKLEEEVRKLKQVVEGMEDANQKLAEENEELRNQARVQQQLAQKEKLLKEEVEEMKATLSCTEEGRARASAHSKNVEKENQELIAKIASLQEENFKVSVETEDLQRRITELCDTNADLQVQIHSFDSVVSDKETVVQEVSTFFGLILLRADKNKLESQMQLIHPDLVGAGLSLSLAYRLNQSSSGSLQTELALAQSPLEVSHVMDHLSSNMNITSPLDETLDREVFLLMQGPSPDHMALEFKSLLNKLVTTSSDRATNVQLDARRSDWAVSLDQLAQYTDSLEKELIKMASNMRRSRTEILHLSVSWTFEVTSLKKKRPCLLQMLRLIFSGCVFPSVSLLPVLVEEEESVQESSAKVPAGEANMAGKKKKKNLHMCTTTLFSCFQAEFQRLALGFKCDMFTLEKRLRLEERSRDLAEENVRREVSSCQGLLQALIPLCEDDTQSMEIIQRLQKNLDILIQSMTRVSSRSEMLGAIHQENRIGKAVEMMIQHVENLKRMYTKEHAELLELRQTMLQNERSFGSQTEKDDFRGKKQTASQYYKVSTKRSFFFLSLSFIHDLQSKPQDLSDADTERLTRRSPWNMTGKNMARPPLKRFVSSAAWVDTEEPSVMMKGPSPSSSPTSADPGIVQSLSQSLMSSRAAAAAVARGSRGLWLWLALLLVLAGLLALLASLVMQPVVDAAPVGTGDSWMTIQQLLWPYTGLRHNGQPPV